MKRIPFTFLVFVALFSFCVAKDSESDRIPVLIVTGANNHDWEWTSRSLESMLLDSGKFDVDVTTDPATALADTDRLARYQAVVLDYNGPRWGDDADEAFLSAVRDDGLGVVVIHASNNAFPGFVEYESLVGHLWRQGTGHGRFHEFDVEITDRDHPITRDLADLKAHPDELYHRLAHMHDSDRRILATAFSAEDTGGTGQAEPMIMVGNHGKGRVFHTPLGHAWKNVDASRVSHADPAFQDLVVRGTEWAATGDVTTQLAPPNTLSEEEKSRGWKLLFNGKNLDGWRGYQQDSPPQQGVTVEDGSIVIQSGGGDLITEGQYGDFEIDFEWAVTEKANSGVMFRVSEDGKETYFTGPEYQVLDDVGLGVESNANHSAGALYGLATPGKKVVRKPGGFNRGRIVARGGNIEHWLNGEKILEFDLDSEQGRKTVAESKFNQWSGFGRNPKGHIALQDHGNRVRYRNIKIRELNQPEEVVLYDGSNLDAWTHHLTKDVDPSEVWSIDEEGVLICKGQPIGYLRTKDDFENFVLRLEWRFNPVTKKSGNSGVLLRMIGEDKVWPKSIEAQLHGGNAGDFWLIGDYPMDPERERTSGRNTKKVKNNENPVGEWNQYEITIDGGDVTLVVNGEVLNRGRNALQVPGKICLQSEGAEIHFRNISLQPLD